MHYQRLIAEDGPWTHAMCWTVVWPATIEQVVVRLGANPDDLEVLELIDSYDAQTMRSSVMHFETSGHAVTIYEYNGFWCSTPEGVNAISIDAEAVSAFWNVNFDTTLSHARGGALLSSGEARHNRTGSHPNSLTAYSTDLVEAASTPHLDIRAGMLSVVESVSSVPLEDEYFRRSHESVTVHF
jgi:Family of unknown function (DUF6461)